jgi:hypothetical protein
MINRLAISFTPGWSAGVFAVAATAARIMR